MRTVESRLQDTEESQTINLYAGQTVLETVGVKFEDITMDQPGPQTPPVPFQTHTRSGQPPVTITDDQDNEHLYE